MKDQPYVPTEWPLNEPGDDVTNAAPLGPEAADEEEFTPEEGAE